MSLLVKKTVVDLPPKNNLFPRGHTLSVNRAAVILKRTRPTLNEWIKQGTLIPYESERVKGRVNHWFENDYIYAIAKILPAKKPGGSVLDENLRAAIGGINRRFGKIK